MRHMRKEFAFCAVGFLRKLHGGHEKLLGRNIVRYVRCDAHIMRHDAVINYRGECAAQGDIPAVAGLERNIGHIAAIRAVGVSHRIEHSPDIIAANTFRKHLVRGAGGEIACIETEHPLGVCADKAEAVFALGLNQNNVGDIRRHA